MASWKVEGKKDVEEEVKEWEEQSLYIPVGKGCVVDPEKVLPDTQRDYSTLLLTWWCVKP